MKISVANTCIHDMVKIMQKAIKALQNGQKKGEPFYRFPQSLGRNLFLDDNRKGPFHEHISKLLPHCSEGLRALIVLMTYTGLRTGEALRVKQEDCKDGYIRVEITKNGDARMVPMPDGWVCPRNGFGFTSTQGVGRAIRRASQLAVLPYRDGHELGRHAFAYRLLKAGHGIKTVKEAGGWKKLAVVDQSYGHLEQTQVHDTMRELSRKKP